jgi:hypothetical protein
VNDISIILACKNNNFDIVKLLLNKINKNSDNIYEKYYYYDFYNYDYDDFVFKYVCRHNIIDIVKILCTLCDNYIVSIENNIVTRQYIKQYPFKKKHTEKEIEECPICMNNKSNIVTDCDHQLCLDCFQQINKTKICHICRHDIVDFFIIK